MKKIQSVLFLLRCSSDQQNAYTHRVLKLKEGLEQHGFQTGIYFIGDDSLTSHTMIPLYFFKMRKLFRQYDAVHAGSAPAGHVAAICSLCSGTRVVFDMHGDRVQEIIQEIHFGLKGRISLIKAWVQQLYAVYGSQLRVPASGPLANLLKKRGLNPKTIQIIRNGVDLELFSPAPVLDRKEKIVTYAGKFQIYQAIDHFIEAAEQIDEPDLRFRIIGFGPEDQALKTSIDKKNNGRFELIDAVPQTVLIQYLQDSDVLVIPRKPSPVTRVALPTKFAEYIALARPVIVADVDETAALVRQWDCGRVYANSSNALKKTILSLTRQSKKELTVMGENGRKLAEAVFDWTTIWRDYAEFLNKG